MADQPGDLPTITVPDVPTVLDAFGGDLQYRQWLADVVQAEVITRTVAQQDAAYETQKNADVAALKGRLPVRPPK